MRTTMLGILLSTVLLVRIVPAAEPEHSAVRTSQNAFTGKERLSNKASDEQRVDDCKIAPGRPTRARPTGCPWDIRS
jgi:hypothetical protein